MNSLGNSVYTLGYQSSIYTVFFKTDFNSNQPWPNWAYSFTGEPWGIVFGSNEN